MNHPRPKKIGIVSLGCPKALVDSENIASRLIEQGFEPVDGAEGADAVVVNTCGFIDAAIDESLDEIARAVQSHEHVVVTGCLGAKGSIVADAFPELDAITGPHAADEVLAAVERIGGHPSGQERRPPEAVPTQMVKLTPSHYAYLKISEGCNHGCTFCIIPDLRGKLVSTPPATLLDEAEELVASGVRELLVVSQDTSAYGVDLRYAEDRWRDRTVRAHTVDLVRELGAIAPWLRLHYVYPYPHVDDIIPLMREGLVLPYLDMPLQHASSRILKAMRRPAATEATLERLRRWREEVPDLTIRSTFIVGFPGETDEDFGQLLDFLAEARIERAGCFTYSDVEGARANELEGHVSESEKLDRQDELLGLQETISAERLRRFRGRTITVLVDHRKGASEVIGRGPGDAPEIDGVVRVENPGDAQPGDFIEVRITDSDAHDLTGIRAG